jgi:HPt (histidine-containing phosphotransfer) domain-containing protein
MKTDLTYLKGMAGGNVDVIKEMIGLFIDQVAEISEEMNVCLEKKDWLHLSKLAHKAKSSVSIMGMTDLSLELKRLEHSASLGLEQESYLIIVQKFLFDCNEAIEELKNYDTEKVK